MSTGSEFGYVADPHPFPDPRAIGDEAERMVAMLRLSAARAPEFARRHPQPDKVLEVGENTRAAVWAAEHADLWWVSADMVSLAQAGAATLPDVPLYAASVPTPAGVAFLECPLMGLDARTGGQIEVAAIAWRVGLTNYSDATRRPAVFIFCLMYGHLGGSFWTAAPRTDWFLEVPWSHQHGPAHEPYDVASHQEDRRWVATLWALASQENLADVTLAMPPRAARRRAERAGRSPEVRVVNLRRTVYEGAGVAPPGTGHGPRVRFPVRGHWRNQPCGPGRTLRRPVFVAPHIKGPLGAPLKLGAKVTVHALRGGPPGDE